MRKPYKTASTNTSLELVEQEVSRKASPTESDMIHRVLARAAMLKDEIVVIKIPAEILSSDDLLRKFLRNIVMLHSSGARVIMVHDYEIIDHIVELFGINKSIAENRQMSDYKSSKVVEMMLSGYINRKIVSILCEMGCDALGMSGKDCNIIRATQKISKITSDNLINIGFVADPTMINPEVILGLLEAQMALVISPVASCDNGSTCVIDTNITTAIIAAALAAKYLILPTHQPNMESGGMTLTDFDRVQIKNLRNDPKSSTTFKAILDTALSAIDNYVDYVCVLDSSKPEALVEQLFCERELA